MNHYVLKFDTGKFVGEDLGYPYSTYILANAKWFTSAHNAKEWLEKVVKNFPSTRFDHTIYQITVSPINE